MYKSIEAFVKIYQETTDEFEFEKGLKQRCILSPTLIPKFINEVAYRIEDVGRHGAQLIPRLTELLFFCSQTILRSWQAQNKSSDS